MVVIRMRDTSIPGAQFVSCTSYRPEGVDLLSCDLGNVR